MAHGMDVEGVRNVINYDLPAYVKRFIHQVGRIEEQARLGLSSHCCIRMRLSASRSCYKKLTFNLVLITLFLPIRLSHFALFIHLRWRN
nr:DEAD-box ATP-dependent RNA helicase 1-like [Quercus suber]